MMEGNMDEMMEALMRHVTGRTKEPDYTKWVQAGKLTNEELQKRKTLEREGLKAAKQVEVMQAEAQHMMSGVALNVKRWWSELYDLHSLPPANYHITRDGRILMQPKGSKNDD